MHNPQHDLLFEPVDIGPVRAKNRFYQVPHCTGLGWLRPKMAAALRGSLNICPNTRKESTCID